MTMSYKLNRQDVLITLGIFCFALLLHFGRIGSSVNGTELATDPAMYCSIAASIGNPEYFAQDFSLGDVANFDTHVTPPVRLVQWLSSHVIDGNCGLAYLSLTGFVVFLHYFAFYLLGRFVFGAPWKALLFSVLVSMCYWTPWGTYWGAGYLDYTPRTIFNGFYGLFLCVLLCLLHKPKLWPLLFFLLAGAVYIHPISALPVAAGTWLSLAFSRQQGCSLVKHFLWLCFAGLCFVIGILPYAATYLHSSGMALSADEVSYLQEVLRTRFEAEYVEYWQGMINFYKQYILLPVLPLALGATWLLLKRGSEKEKLLCRHIWLWVVGVYIVIALFLADQIISASLGRVPLEFDLARVHRFLPFLWMFLIFLGCNLLWRLAAEERLPHKGLCRFLCVAVCIGFFLGGLQTMAKVSLPYYFYALDKDRYEQAYAAKLARNDMLKALQVVTRPGDTIFAPFEDQAIRYIAKRPLAWSWKDAGYLYHAKNLPLLHKWEDILKELRQSPTAYISTGASTGACYIVSDRKQDRELLEEQVGPVVWENSVYLVVKNLKKP